MCHLDRTVAERATLKRLAGTGCMLEYDLFGNEFSYYRPNPDFDMPSDAQRLAGSPGSSPRATGTRC